LDAIDSLQAKTINKALVMLQNIAVIIPAKSGHDENSKENDAKESKGMPAVSGAALETAMGFEVEGICAASASNEATRAPRTKERFIEGNILVVRCRHYRGHLRRGYGHRRQRKFGQIVMRQLKTIDQVMDLVFSMEDLVLYYVGERSGYIHKSRGRYQALCCRLQPLACMRVCFSADWLALRLDLGTAFSERETAALHIPSSNM
jgi:hypothetical protein